jgi:hypothetical protein
MGFSWDEDKEFPEVLRDFLGPGNEPRPGQA